MGYYLRYVVADERPVSVADVQRAFAGAGARYRVEAQSDVGRAATILYDGQPVAELEINEPGDGLFEDEREELLEEAADAEGRGKRGVLSALRGARRIVAAQVLLGGGEATAALARLAPLWEWLAANRRGVLQADGEGYYDGGELVLRVD